MKSTSTTTGYLAALSLAIYTVFKFCYLSGAKQIMIGCGILLSLYFALLMLDKTKQASEKKLIMVNIVAAICAVVMIFAILAKFQNWQMSGVLFVIGLTGISLFFIPMTLIQKMKKQGESKLLNLIGAVGLEFLCWGILNKLQHWWFADSLFVAGMATVFLGYFPLYLFKKNNPSDKQVDHVGDIFFVTIIGLLFFIFVFGILMNWKVTMNYII